MKVISGLLKGRMIDGYSILGTRPTMDRVRESIFAMIQERVCESVVLDLFAGTGSYGIEAISNYARVVYFNDSNKECTNTIKKNLTKFSIEKKGIVSSFDYLKCLHCLKNESLKFDIIFLDPPYQLHVIGAILTFIEKNHLLNQKGVVVCEFQGDKLQENYGNLEKFKERKYGEKEVYIYKWKE